MSPSFKVDHLEMSKKTNGKGSSCCTIDAVSEEESQGKMLRPEGGFGHAWQACEMLKGEPKKDEERRSSYRQKDDRYDDEEDDHDDHVAKIVLQMFIKRND